MNNPLTKRYYLTVLWGDEAGYTEVYEWATAAERLAFMSGVNECDVLNGSLVSYRWHEHDKAIGDQDLPEPDSLRSLNDE